MLRSFRAAPVIVALFVAGCPADDEPASSGSDSEGEGETDPVGEACEPLRAGTAGPVMLRVTNATSEPIFLDQPDCLPPLDVFGPDGSPAQWLFTSCTTPSCDDAVARDCAIACADCASGVIRVRPGGTYEQLWNGSIWQDAEVPADCAAQTCGPQCQQPVAAADGQYRLTTPVFRECPFDDPASCDCAGGDQDACAIFVGAPVGAMASEESVMFAVPGDVAELIIE